MTPCRGKPDQGEELKQHSTQNNIEDLNHLQSTVNNPTHQFVPKSKNTPRKSSQGQVAIRPINNKQMARSTG